MPQGDIFGTRNGSSVKWYLKNGSHPIYISKKEQSLISNLILKKYYELRLSDLTAKLNHISNEPCETAVAMLESHSIYKDILLEKLNLQSYWSQENYERSSSHPEHLIHKTLKGDLVRSKSEVIIANALFLNNIPYKYECALYIDEIAFFPDFTIIHPTKHKIYYWEHFGMMDTSTYSDSAYNKLKLYAQKGIIPSINLITTYETRECPIDSTLINNTIKDYFIESQK